MTYWYPGAAEAIRMVRDIWPDVPVVLGGIYASLCPAHASGLGADLVLGGRIEDPQVWDRLWRVLGSAAPELPDGAGLELALDLYPDPDFSVILGSRGCPFRCVYCASRSLYPGFRQGRVESLLSSVQAEYDRGVRDFAFYDDALLVAPEKWLWPLLEWFEGKGARLHTPNAMHARYLTPEVCRRLKRAGTHTVRLGLETGDFEHRLDLKISHEQWRAGLLCVRPASPPDRSGPTSSSACRTRTLGNWSGPSPWSGPTASGRNWPISPPSPPARSSSGPARRPPGRWPKNPSARTTPSGPACREVTLRRRPAIGGKFLPVSERRR